MPNTHESRRPNYIKYALDDSRVGKPSTASSTGRAGDEHRCGDVIELYLSVSGGVITSARYRATGCPGALASAAATAELAEGIDLDSAARVTEQMVSDLLVDLPAEKRSCSNLGAAALRGAIENYVSGSKMSPLPQFRNRTAVAMSGGVDSSTTASLLKAEGQDVIGLTMRLHDHGGLATNTCCSPEDLDDAAAVAARLSIPHYTVDLRERFAELVIDRFCREYLNGRTPNPCVDCNRYIKFRLLRGSGASLGASRMATGHYARIEFDGTAGRWLVRRAMDGRKDQSYMFWCADQDTLSAVVTPLGSYTKREVRDMAQEAVLPVAEKRESQEICFVPDNDYRGFLERRGGARPAEGPIVNTAGDVVGSHSGLANYTVGQRRGLGISTRSRLYVLSLDSTGNKVVVGSRQELETKAAIVGEVNWIAVPRITGGANVHVMHRYNSDPVPARLNPLDNDRVLIEFDRGAYAVTPGQSIVFYEGDVVLGGGICESAERKVATGTLG